MEDQRAKLAKIEIPDESLRTTGEMSGHIPFDAIAEILKGLPIKDLARSICIAKGIAPLIRNRDFVKSYLIKSSTHPSSLIFTFKSLKHQRHFFLSASQPKERGSSSSSYSYATYHMQCYTHPYPTLSPSVHGLICHGPPSKLMLYNPSTRRTLTLPKFTTYAGIRLSYVGYDPVNGVYKVLFVTAPLDRLAQEIRVLTLGEENSSWREIQDFPTHYLDFGSPDVCVGGVLFYRVYFKELRTCAVMSFDVSSEKFKLIKVPDGAQTPMLTSYEGKLAILFSGSNSGSICLSVLEDVAKQEWSTKSYVLPMDRDCELFCVTHAGEIVLAHSEYSGEFGFYVYYYDPKKGTVRTVYIEGITQLKLPLWDEESTHRLVSIFSGQVDNPMFL